MENRNLHFIFVGGKGGVGKTTSSSALAAQLCYDRRVLIISTDPAHSLGDAFRQQFARGEPTEVEGLPNLHVLEVNPEKFLREELDEWAMLAESAGASDVVEKLKEMQEWLTGIPGIDEAVALTSVIDFIESGEYDVVVFDTAPTGHTVKLLGLPAVLQMGLEKIQGFQTTMWMYWQTFQAFSGVQSNPEDVVNLRNKVEDRLQRFKEGVEQVGAMMKDAVHTVFVVVCIAEHLSISESRRLLEELKRQNVLATHIVVNQLVHGMSNEQIAKLDDHLPAVDASTDSNDAELWEAVKKSVKLSSARQNIQQAYLSQLRAMPETVGLRVVEVPLLPHEVTGPARILDFSQNLVPTGYRTASPRPLERKLQPIQKLYPHLVTPKEKLEPSTKAAGAADAASSTPSAAPAPSFSGDDVSGSPTAEVTETKAPKEEEQGEARGSEQSSMSSSAASNGQPQNDAAKASSGTLAGTGGFAAGDAVVITGLSKTPHYNALRGYVTDAGRADARLSVAVQYDGARKMLLLKSENLEPDIEDAEKSALLSDPELVKFIANPRLLSVYEELRAHPETLSTHLKDPEIGPAVERAMKLLRRAGRPAATATD